MKPESNDWDAQDMCEGELLGILGKRCEDGIFEAVDELCDEGLGDILIFMNGEREIRDTADALSKRNLKGTEIVPLYARLSAGEQNKIFNPPYMP